MKQLMTRIVERASGYWLQSGPRECQGPYDSVEEARRQGRFLGLLPPAGVPEFTETYTISCCDGDTDFSNKQEAIDWLVRHLESSHPDLMKTVENAASAACNRHDDPGFGWKKANKSCRQSWRREVVLGVLHLAQKV